VTTVTVEGTRPILQLDTQHNQANVFLTDPPLAANGSQAIYRRTAPLDTLNFGAASIGTPVIQSATESAINDSTSTKQAAVAASGMLVVATNIPTLQYFHACMGDPCPAKPVANFTTNTTAGPAPLGVQFTDTSTNAPTAWSWNFGDGGTSTLQSPSHTYAAPGTYTVTLTASNLAGSDSVTKTDHITVTAPAPNEYFPINPVRVFDSRPAPKHVGTITTLAANAPQTGQVGGRLGIPSDAIAVTGNLTVVGQTRAGFFAIGPSLTGLGSTSSLNFPVGDVRANGVTVPLNDNSNGTLSVVFKSTASGSANVVFDVTGYFRQTATGGNTYHTVTPARFLDTRKGNGLSGRFQAKIVRTFQVTGRTVGGTTIPATAKAITGNLTVAGQTTQGFVSLGPDAGTVGSTSTLNFPVGDVRANNVTVKLSGTGSLAALFTAVSGSTDLVLDITGYFTADESGAYYVPVTPTRILDSRKGNGLSGTFVSQHARTWVVGSPIDPNAVAVIGNVTAVGATQGGFVAVTPSPTNTPATSSLNFPVGDVRANGMTVKLSDIGSNLSATYVATSTTATTHLVYDVFGYYK
jgi:PKD repeat protein